MRVGPASVKDAIEAVLAAGIGSRDDFYWTLHAVLVSRHEDHATFDEAFRLFWKSRELIEKMLAMFSPVAPDQQGAAEAARRRKPRRRSDVRGPPQGPAAAGNPRDRDRRALHRVRQRDAARQGLCADDAPPNSPRRSRRSPSSSCPSTRSDAPLQAPIPRGRRIDPRAMMRLASRTGGELILPKFRSPREVHPPLVVLADISGSMSQYTRIFLHFLHALTEKRRRVHTFVFGTRLTNLTRQMRHRDPDEALADCSAAVKDWSGGTRIGDTLPSSTGCGRAACWGRARLCC